MSTAWIADVLQAAVATILADAIVEQTEESTVRVLLPEGTRVRVQVTVDQRGRTDK